MTEQLSMLWDRARPVLEARAARDVAIERVDRNADVDWKEEAKRALWNRIQVGGEFTTDDLECSTPREPRAWGAIIRAAARAGWIENTGRVRQSSQVRCHARPKTVWNVIRKP